MKTIRTENKGRDYFYDKAEKYARKNKKKLVLGHLHREHIGYNIRVLDSAGYNNKLYSYIINNKLVLVIADLHLGIEETDENAEKIINRIKIKKNVSKVIFLGDTLDMSKASNEDINQRKFFWNWLKKTDAKVIFIVGNHDINLLNNTEPLRKKIIEINQRIKIMREYSYNNYIFSHGDVFDYYVKKFGLLYLAAFRLSDYINGSWNWFVNWIYRHF